MSTTYTLGKGDFTQMVCGKCGIEFYVPAPFQLEQRQLGPLGGFYCPNGHSRIFAESETSELRRERDRLQQRLAEKDDEIASERLSRHAEQRRVSAAKGQITKLKNRASKGVCPCCNRHFTDLERHMHTKHPSFVTEPDATEHVH